jgi:hypothetical protein
MKRVNDDTRCPGGMVSPPPAIEQTGAKRREIESRQGIIGSFKKIQVDMFLLYSGKNCITYQHLKMRSVNDGTRKIWRLSMPIRTRKLLHDQQYIQHKAHLNQLHRKQL